MCLNTRSNALMRSVTTITQRRKAIGSAVIVADLAFVFLSEARKVTAIERVCERLLNRETSTKVRKKLTPSGALGRSLRKSSRRCRAAATAPKSLDLAQNCAVCPRQIRSGIWAARWPSPLLDPARRSPRRAQSPRWSARCLLRRQLPREHFLCSAGPASVRAEQRATRGAPCWCCRRYLVQGLSRRRRG